MVCQPVGKGLGVSGVFSAHLIQSRLAFPTLPHVPLAGEAHLLLDGIQDAPHVLIHLQALEQSSFTGKGEERAWSLRLDPGRRGNSYSSPVC